MISRQNHRCLIHHTQIPPDNLVKGYLYVLFSRCVCSWVSRKYAGTKGKLRLASTYLPSHYLVPKWLAAYKQVHEQVEIEIRTGNSQQSIERLLRCQADLAVITNESWDNLPIRRFQTKLTQHSLIIKR